MSCPREEIEAEVVGRYAKPKESVASITSVPPKV